MLLWMFELQPIDDGAGVPGAAPDPPNHGGTREILESVPRTLQPQF